MANEPNLAIDVRGLTKRYADITALDHVSLHIPQGTLFGLMGHNGAGKSTLIRMLLGLIQPTAGSATVLGYDIQKESLEVRRRCGFLPEVFSLPKDLTPRSFLEYIGSMFGESGPILRQKVDTLLEQFGLLSVANKSLGGFSKGMAQKVALIQALINHPQVLFLDEPTTGLDPIGRHELLQFLKQLATTQGVTVLFSSHILSDIESVCRQVAIFHRGHLLAEGSLEQLKQNAGTSNMDDLYFRLVQGART